MSGFRPSLDFSAALTLSQLFLDRTCQVRGVWGPVGSGKSTLCCADLMQNAFAQPIRDGWIRSRHAIIRNTAPMLRSTTVKTWLEIFPEQNCGPITYGSPIAHRIKVPPKDDRPGFDAEFLFMALDDIRDIAKLKSFEITSAWVNEASEVPVAIAQKLLERIGRYPKRIGDSEAVDPHVIWDSNATDEDNELRRLELDAPGDWKFYHQPPAVLEVQLLGGKVVCTEPDPRYNGQVFTHADVIKAAGRAWVVNPQAENLRNLRTGYYRSISGQLLEQIQRDKQVKFVYVQDGRPVVPEFSATVHVVEDTPMLEGVPLEMGGDIGGGTLNPAAVIGQKHASGTILVHDELVCGDVALKEFCSLLQGKLAEPHLVKPNIPVGRFHGDPAGSKRDELFGEVIFDHLRAAGFDAHPISTNDTELRVQAVRAPFARMIRGKPAILINRRCKTLIAALAGKWKYRRLQVATGGDTARYHDKPEKLHPYSDAGDALQYLIIGFGEIRALQGRGERNRFPAAPVQARVDFDIFGGN